MITDRGRTEKPLLRARPVRDIPKSTPRLNPPVQCGLCFRRRAFGRISFKDTALILVGRCAEDNCTDTRGLMSLTRAHVMGGRTRNSTTMAFAIFQTGRDGEGGAGLFKTPRFVSLPQFLQILKYCLTCPSTLLK